MGFRRTAALGALSLLLFATGAAAQQSCPGGPADARGVEVAATVAGAPADLAVDVEQVLAARGYEVPDSLRRDGEWTSIPLWVWLLPVQDEGWHGREHPGIVASARARAQGDSTAWTFSARAVCNLESAEDAARPGSVEATLEALSAIDLAKGLLGMVAARRGDAGKPLSPGGEAYDFSLTIPERVSDFRARDRHDFPDRSLGTAVHYRGPERVEADVYIYPGPPPELRCTPACGALQVEMETVGFTGGFALMINRGMVKSISATGDERLTPPPGAAWAAGRHLTLAVDRDGRTQESHFYLFAFPEFMLKVRSTFPPSEERAARLRAFVDDALAKFSRPTPAP